MDLSELEQLRPRITGWLVSGGLTPEDAEEVAADAIAQAAMHLKQGGAVEPGYVWKLAGWRKLDAVRRVEARHEGAGALLDLYAAAEVPPDEGLDETTEAALAALSNRQREAVTLAADGYSNKEIGERMGSTAGSAAHMLHRAHATARKDRDEEPSTVAPVVPRALSPRELDVVRALADGLDYKASAALLDLSPETVKNYLQTAYAKLGVHNGPHCVATAIRKKIIE